MDRQVDELVTRMDDYLPGGAGADIREQVSAAFTANATAAGPAPKFAELAGSLAPPARRQWRHVLSAAAGIAVVAAGVLLMAGQEPEPLMLDSEFALVANWQGSTDEFLGLPFQEYQYALPRFDAALPPYAGARAGSTE